jgi:cytochrome c oxidase subunit IV
MKMNIKSAQIQTQDSVFKRILWLYGLFTLLSNASFLVGYYLLPEGFMRKSPLMAAGELVASVESFWPQFGLTLLFNVGLITVIGVGANLQQVRNFPAGYLIPIFLGIGGGLIVGTNSFIASDLSRYSVRDGMALGLSIGELEMLAYIMTIASTVKFGIYQYRNLADWKPTKVQRLCDVRLSRQEILCLIIAVLLLIFAAYRETAMTVMP